MSAQDEAYRRMLLRKFQKITRLRFLNPDGSVAFALDNKPQNRKSGAFLADGGTITCNLQNGQRRTATVKIANADGAFDYNFSHVWYGTEIAIDEGLVLPNGADYYLPQGVFLISDPTDAERPNERTIQYNLVDKWANLDGTLGGNLEATYSVAAGTNIYEPISALLKLDRGNGYPVDGAEPIFTAFYNGKTQELPDGSNVLLTNAPYTLNVDGDGSTYADVILGLTGMLNAWVGYDVNGQLRVDPSQDDILDSDKPVLWRFRMGQAQIASIDTTYKIGEVYNDYICVGEMLDDNRQPAGRAQNLDPASDTNVNLIGRKTFRETKAGFATDTICRDYAVWKLKRSAVLRKAITISCSQMFHLEENALIEIARTDKPGAPLERHLIQGFSRPLVGTGPMTINAISVNDFPAATVTGWPE